MVIFTNLILTKMKKHIVFTLVLLLPFFLSLKANSLTFSDLSYASLADDEGFKARITLGGKTYDLLNYSLNFNGVDKVKLDAMPLNTTLNINILSVGIKTSKVDQELMDWILTSGGTPKDGQIVITNSETGKVVKTITFTLLKPNTYNESFYNNNVIINSQSTATSFNMHFDKVSIKQ